ncbi:unnamed protein product [Caenorhabditis angaria]|uniref:Uncharacterized protein n=1 Tax=Caenorhabditis angaria TaxID=860376 RepID=A0A9P1N0M2_9PELO|nr:unnamed protein product [Caenorhabditis angaria]
MDNQNIIAQLRLENKRLRKNMTGIIIQINQLKEGQKWLQEKVRLLNIMKDELKKKMLEIQLAMEEMKENF